MTLKTAIKNRDIKAIREITSQSHEAEIADLLENMTNTDRVIYFRLLNKTQQAKVFSSLEHDFQEQLIHSFSDKQIKGIVDLLYTDEIADLVEDVPEYIAKRILQQAPKEVKEDINKILRYSGDVIGSVMTVDIVLLKQSLTVGKAIEYIKSKKDEVYMSQYFFVIDSKKLLIGFITLEDLMFTRNSKKLKELANPSGYVLTTANKEEAANVFADYDMSVLPVVNTSKQVIGVITSDDMIDVIQDAATEDMQKMAGIEYDDEIPYSRTKTKKLFKSRIIWLLLLMISATISQIVLDAFQGFSSDLLDNSGNISISSISLWTTAIVAILPVISGAAGNAGSQSSTMVIRSLAIGDITTKDYLKVIWKETKVSTLVGLSLGIANFVRLVIYYSVRGDMADGDASAYLFLALAASLSLFVVIILAKVVGGTLPILAKKFKFDPATMAAPLLTTLIDALSTMIFFGVSIGIMVLAI